MPRVFSEIPQTRFHNLLYSLREKEIRENNGSKTCLCETSVCLGYEKPRVHSLDKNEIV